MNQISFLKKGFLTPIIQMWINFQAERLKAIIVLCGPLLLLREIKDAT